MRRLCAVALALLASPLGCAQVQGIARPEASPVAAIPPSVGPYCPGERYEVRTPPLSSELYVELTIGGRTGPFLIDYGATSSSVEAGVLAPGGGSVELTGPSWPGVPSRVRYSVFDRNVDVRGVGTQWGVIGTDLLSRVVVEVRLEDATDPHLVVSDQCDTSGLRARGFWRFDQRGHFGASGSGSARANVPVVWVDLQAGAGGPGLGARAWAQIDPGYGDAVWPYSVDVNEALFHQLESAGAPLTEVGRVPVTDCEGVERLDSVYVAPGHRLRIEDETGTAMYRVEGFYIVRKGAASASCKGIATLAEPGAQLSASFLRLFGRVVFDPTDSAVWVLPTPFDDLAAPDP